MYFEDYRHLNKDRVKKTLASLEYLCTLLKSTIRYSLHVFIEGNFSPAHSGSLFDDEPKPVI